MIQVYTGNGKGKTTAALGLALRAAGAGLKVYIAQFIKKGCYNELKSLKKLKNITIEQFGRGCFIRSEPCKEDIELAHSALNRIKEIISKGKFDIVILDEINTALNLKLIKLREALNIIHTLPKKTELILTGRYAHPEIIKKSDLVSEIKEIKHYYKRGVKARKGIEF